MTGRNLDFFTRTFGKISKVVYKKTLVRRYGVWIHSHNYNRYMLISQDCIKLPGCIAWQSFLVNNFADFLKVVRVKKIKILFTLWWRLKWATSAVDLQKVNTAVVNLYVLLTLFDIMIVSSALLCELKATFSVVAWNKTKIAWRTAWMSRVKEMFNIAYLLVWLLKKKNT